MSSTLYKSKQQQWAEFRFSVVGPLLSSPPERGELTEAVKELSLKVWKHPSVPGREFSIGESTIERWYYKARNSKSTPMESLRKIPRSDSGSQRAMDEKSKEILLDLYNKHHGWSYQLHRDNLAAALAPHGLEIPSYSTVRRFFHSVGKIKELRKRGQNRDGFKKSWEQRSHFECRSYENQYVNGLWHLDFHHCSRSVITTDGEVVYPVALAVLDDYSRLICHLQWYLTETAEDLVHGFTQALLKRKLPRKLLTDNGSAMISQEFTQGLLRLSILHETTLPYSPHQNGKQEVFWGQLEGRLMAMLENQKHITLKQLNDYSQMWVEKDYNHGLHKETKETPYERFIKSNDVSRPCLPMEDLTKAFARDEKRRIRSTDCSITLGNKRFEIPFQYHHRKDVTVRYAIWDLSNVYLVDEQSGKILSKIFPTDKAFNAVAGRRSRNPVTEATNQITGGQASTGNAETAFSINEDLLPPLLRAICQEHEATGNIPAYLPKEV